MIHKDQGVVLLSIILKIIIILCSIKNLRLSINSINSIKNNSINNKWSPGIRLIRNLEGSIRDHLILSARAHLPRNKKPCLGIEKVIWGKLTRDNLNCSRLEIQGEELIIDYLSNKLPPLISHLPQITSWGTNPKKCCLLSFEIRPDHLIVLSSARKVWAETHSK